MQIIKYETESEAEQIKVDKLVQGYTLVAVSNVTEGNFLGFQEPDWVPSIIDPVSEQRFAELNGNQLILMEVLATMYEDMILKGTV